MNLQPFATATIEAFGTLVGVDVTPIDHQCSGDDLDIFGLVTFTTSNGFSGSLVLGVPRDLAHACCQVMFGESDDESAADLIGEIVNTVAGKGLALSRVVSQMSVPSLVIGHASRIQPHGEHEHFDQVFSCQDSHFLLRLYHTFKESRDAAPNRADR